MGDVAKEELTVVVVSADYSAGRWAVHLEAGAAGFQLRSYTHRREAVNWAMELSKILGADLVALR